MVGLVEDEHLDTVEADGALLEMVEQPARRRHQDVDATGHRGDLRLLADAAEDHRRAQPEMPAVGAEAVTDLDRQLAGRGQHQAARGPALERSPSRAIARGGKALQDRQRESGGLAGAGLGDAQQIAAGQQIGDRLRLDRRRHGVAFLGERATERLDQRQVLE